MACQCQKNMVASLVLLSTQSIWKLVVMIGNECIPHIDEEQGHSVQKGSEIIEVNRKIFFLRQWLCKVFNSQWCGVLIYNKNKYKTHNLLYNFDVYHIYALQPNYMARKDTFYSSS